MTGRRSIRRLAALVSSAILALGAAGSISRPVAAGTCQFYCDTVSVVNVPHGIGGNPGSGTVATTDGRINCVVVNGVVQSGSVCSYRYTIYTVTFPYTVHLTFTPSTGAFVCLASTCYGESQQLTVDTTLDPPYQTEAQYEKDFGFYWSSRQLVVEELDGGGSLKSTPAGIACGDGVNDCAFDYPYGQVVKVTANADPGQVFLGWGYDCKAETTSTCTLTMTALHPVSAVFGAAPTAAPTPTPRPTPTRAPGSTAPPKATASAGPSASKSAAGSAAPSSAAAGTTGATPGASAAVSPSASPSGVVVESGASTGPGAAAPATALGTVGQTATTFDSTPIVLAIVFAAIVIALGIVAAALIGRRRPGSNPPTG